MITPNYLAFCKVCISPFKDNFKIILLIFLENNSGQDAADKKEEVSYNFCKIR